MTPHLQRFLHDPEAGVWGDCDRTALACLLDLEPEQVPHFMHGAPINEPMPPAIAAWRQSWLRERGLVEVEAAYPAAAFASLADLLAFWAGMSPGLHYRVVGRAPRGVDHVVVARDHLIVHDPHPAGGGLVGPAGSGCYHVLTLAKLL